LSGLEAAAGRAIFEEENLRGSEEEFETLVRQYSGNPLALILIADTIKNFHDGHTAAFLNTETSVFANIQVVLEQQFVRLTRLEEQIMLWLAVEREPVAIQLLAEQIQLPHTQANLIAALHSLHQRSLIERRVNGFTLQNVLMEFTTDFLVSAVVKELVQGQADYFAHLPLLKASAMTFVRRTQERLLLQPVARQLLYRGGKNQAISLLKELLASLPTPILQYSYAPGNILNLLVYLDVKEPLDFSDAAVWQVNLRGKVVPPISFSGANLNGAAFTDYGGYILKLAFNADGTRLAGSAISGEIRLWDMGTRKPLLTIAGHQDFAGSLCFSPDGRFLVSGGGDGNACVWDAETGRRLHRYPTHDNAVRPVVFAPDGKWIAGASFNRLTFWNPTSDETLFSHSFSNGYVEALAVSPDGGILAFSNKEYIQLWDIQATLAAGAGQVLHKFFSNQDRIKQLAFSPDGQLVASNGNKVRLWEVKTGQTVMDLVAGTHQIESIAFHPDGEIIAGGSKDSIYLWNVRSGELLRAFVAHEETIVSLIFNPDGDVLVSSSEDHTVRLWDMNGQNLHTIQGFVNMIHGVDLSPDGRFLACGSDDRMVRLWDFHSGELLDTWRGHESRVHRVVFSPDGKSLAASSRDRLVRVWAVPSGEEKYQLPTGEVPYHAVAWSPDCLWLATGDREGALSIWEAENGNHYKTFFHDTIVCAVSFPVNGEHVAAVCFDNKIYIWEMGNSHLKQILPGHDNEVWALEHSPDGRFLVSGSDDCTVRFWDLASGECRHVLEHHTGWVQALAFDRRGDLMLTGSQDQSIGIWDVSRLNLGGPPQLIYSLNGHTARVTDVSFCPDGATIVSSSLDETIRFWAVSTGECLDKWAIPGPYKGMDITNASGLTKAQRRSLRSLGAVEKSWSPNTDS
jgi:WD40 repeat protein